MPTLRELLITQAVDLAASDMARAGEAGDIVRRETEDARGVA
jgi:hypothetical protein